MDSKPLEMADEKPPHKSESEEELSISVTTYNKLITTTDNLQSVEDNLPELKEEYEALVSYLPATVIQFINTLVLQSVTTADLRSRLPLVNTFETVALFADVSGFTSLTEEMARKGPEGAEHLAHYLNAYLAQIVKSVASYGGDVFKFAGDAMIVLWPPSSLQLGSLVRKACQAALDIQEKLFQANLAESVVLSVKIGIGVGKVSVVLIGGERNRMEYLASGDPLNQAFAAEHHADPGDVILSSEAWKLAEPFFKVKKQIDHSFTIINECLEPLHRVGIAATLKISELYDRKAIDAIKNYVPGAIIPYINTPMERYASELRRVAIMFVSVGLSQETLRNITMKQDLSSLVRVQEAVSRVQAAVYKYEGSLNKFLFDDKGSTLLAVFGLPPLAHIDDSLRAVFSSFEVTTSLKSIGLGASIGVTTGTAFCGVAGSHTRKEYAVLGDVVNLSARLMQHAKKSGKEILCDMETSYLSRNKVAFDALEPIFVKGKKEKIKIFEPLNQGNFGLRLRSLVSTNVKPFRIPLESHPEEKLDSPASEPRSPSTPLKSKVFSGFFKNRSTTISKLDISSNLSSTPRESPTSLRLSLRQPPKLAQYNEKASPASKIPGFFKSRRHITGKDHLHHYSIDWTDSNTDEILNGSRKSSGTTVFKLGSEVPLPMDEESRNDIKSQDLHGSRRSSRATRSSSVTEASHSVSITQWYTSALVRLPEDLLDGVCISFKIVDSVLQLKKSVLEYIRRHPNYSQGYQPSLKEEDFKLAITESQFAIDLEFLRVDVVPVMVPDLQLNEDRSIELTLTRSFKAEVFPKDDRQIIRNQFSEIANSLIDQGKSSVVFLEGEMGYGKTKLLADTICKAPTLVCCSTASSVITGKTLEVVEDVMLQIIDHSIEQLSEDMVAIQNIWEENSTLLEKRRAFIVQKFTDQPNLKNLLAALNIVVRLDIVESEEFACLSENAKMQTCEDLLIALLKDFSCEIPYIIVIDDAVYMDSHSWAFMARVASEVPRLVIVFSGPPMNMAYLRTFMRKSPEQYRTLLEQENAVHFKLKPLPNSIIYNIALSSLGVRTIREKLVHLLLTKSRGNPLVCKELIFELRQHGLINVVENGKNKICMLSNDFGDASCPVPTSMSTMLGCRLDRLAPTLQMLLKVASIIGNHFSLNTLLEIYPIPEHRDIAQLEKFIFELCELNVLSFVDEAKREADFTISKSDRVYEFVDGFMREVVMSRMLKKLRKPLEVAVQKLFSDRRTVSPKKSFIRKEVVMDTIDVSKSGSLSSHAFQKNYKQRLVKLTGDELIIYEPESTKVWRQINLDDEMKVVSVTEDESGKPYCLRIESHSWVKNDVLNTDRTVWFYLSFAEGYQAEEWKLRLSSWMEISYSTSPRSLARSPSAAKSIEDVRSILSQHYDC